MKNWKKALSVTAAVAVAATMAMPVIIPAPFEPPVRSLRATLPAHQSHTFR